MTDTAFPSVEPRCVWDHFATLCAIPRPSKKERALRDRLLAWAGAHGLTSHVDGAGNLILSKPATPGREDRAGVILQGHLDMVCQKNAGTAHDFERDPIRPVLRDGWLIAEDTTLGADNGIGVALALAALVEPGLEHPPIEVLLTIDEEAGMGGARALAPGSLSGTRLINLDTEEWGAFYLGCAGGMDVVARRTCQREAIPTDHVVWRLDVAGLKGGHSGIDIHRGRGNAIKLLVETLQACAHDLGARLIDFEGGTARNAIPREARARIALPASQAARLPELIGARLGLWQPMLAGIDDGVCLSAVPDASDAPGMLGQADQLEVLDFLATVPSGVQRMSDDFPGVVETSDSLGVARLDAQGCEAVLMVRSLIDAQADALAGRTAALATSAGFQADKVGPYPGWRPNPESGLLATARTVYAREFGDQARHEVIHAGLECGLLGASHPGLDMLSFGPDIRGAHAPGERVEVTSVARCWQLLKALLSALP
jgi:dipeptidase D